MHIGPFGFHPCGRLLAGQKFRDSGRCFTDGRVTAVEMPADRGGSTHVVVGQPDDGGFTVLGVVGLYQCAGILADQVMHAITAAGGFGDQMLVEKLIKAAAGRREAGAVESGGGIRIDVRSRVQPETAEQPPLADGEVLI